MSGGGSKDLGSSLMALSQQSAGSMGGGSYMGRGGGLGSGTVGGRGGGRGGPGGMSSYSAYQTNNKRKFEGGGRGGGGRGGFNDGEEKKPRKDNKPREGREPGLNIFIDPKFNYWNLPVKARVLLISNVPQVNSLTLTKSLVLT